ncbi:hypothetical protein UY3_01510 [Chelonia mydas]|uniref:Uncharacterized protein n=1 Tax=Chelonia mydas TaxID=8469 RepID=M7BZJ2_CHEMY|nr:hypothetical protein UY3_01510 [Chelonia mydas]
MKPIVVNTGPDPSPVTSVGKLCVSSFHGGPTFWQDLETPTQKSMPSRRSLGQKTTPTPTLQTLHDRITGFYTQQRAMGAYHI